ncbi:MAG: hypothetical protein N2445_07650 [Acidobacteria bacterium]|nr:hypothetical protein [Acidobacteriota bacterium]
MKMFSMILMFGNETFRLLSVMLIIPLVYFLYNFEKKMGIISKMEFNEEKLKKKRIYSLLLILTGFFFLIVSFIAFNFSKGDRNYLVLYFALLFSLFLGLISFSSGLWHLLASHFDSRKAMINGGAILCFISLSVLGIIWVYFRVSLMPKIYSQSQVSSFYIFFAMVISLLSLSMIGSSLTFIFNGLKKK